MTCGIYRLVFPGLDKVYIGKSKNIEYRFTQHLYKLLKCTSSIKLQKAYAQYGNPSLEILNTCEEAYLNEYEKEAIEIFNSVTDGLNTYDENRGTPATVRERGEDCAVSKYSNALVSTVLDYLVDQPHLTALQIAEETNVNVHTVRAISALNEHKWLKDAYPDKYAKLEQLKGLKAKANKFSSAALGKVVPAIVSPDGIVYSNITNIKEFCGEHSLQSTNLGAVLNGRRKSHKGWKLA